MSGASPAKPKQLSDHVVVGQFSGTHGVRGGFKVRSFTDDPADVAAYGPVVTATGLHLTLSLDREMKPGLFLARAPEVTSPEACEPFKGALLHVHRDRLPAPDEDEFYLSDLEGLAAITAEAAPAGRVKAVVNFGAGDLIELTGVPEQKGSILIPFTKADVPHVDLAAGTVTVVLPDAADPDETPDDA